MSPKEAKPLELTRGEFIVKSTPLEHTYEGKTKIYRKESHSTKEAAWELDFYIGSRAIEISPSGDTLVLFGNIFFGNIVKNSDTEKLLQIYVKDKGFKNYSYKDITKNNLADDIKRWGITLLGGGWVSLSDKFTFQEVDWKNSKVIFKYDKKSLEFEF